MKLRLSEWYLPGSATAIQVGDSDQNIPMMKLSVFGYDFSDLKTSFEYNF